MFIDLRCVYCFNVICFISLELFELAGRTSLQALQRRIVFWRTLSKIPDLFRIVSHAARILDTRSSSACTYLYEGDVCYHMFHISNYPPLLPTRNPRKFIKTVLLHPVYVVLLFTHICVLFDM